MQLIMRVYYVPTCYLHSSDNMKNIFIIFTWVLDWFQYRYVWITILKQKKNKNRKELSYSFVLRMYTCIFLWKYKRDLYKTSQYHNSQSVISQAWPMHGYSSMTDPWFSEFNYLMCFFSLLKLCLYYREIIPFLLLFCFWSRFVTFLLLIRCNFCNFMKNYFCPKQQ